MLWDFGQDFIEIRVEMVVFYGMRNRIVISCVFL